MDNISHTVVSLVAGELIHRTLKPESTESAQNFRQKLILFTAAAAGNFPDLDLFLYSQLRKPLGYLLHHRGHSHTFLYEIPQALFLLLLIAVCSPAARRLMTTSSTALRGTLFGLAAGFFLHISMDFLNSYGVHPFHPIDSHWIYGDLVFIIEPLFWIGFGIPVAMLTKRLWLRYPVGLAMLSVPIWATYAGFVPLISMIALLMIAAVLVRILMSERESGRWALSLPFLLSFVFIGGQAFATRAAKSEVRASIIALDPANEFFDAAMTAAPANPFCWSYVSIERNAAAGVYRLRNGRVSIAPSVVQTSACPSPFVTETEVTVRSPFVSEYSVTTGSIEKLKEAVESSCHLRAWLRFARMPLITETTASDLRFARGPRGNFTTLEREDFANVECNDSAIPPWVPPRADDLLRF